MVEMIWMCSRAQVKVFFCLLILAASAVFFYYFVVLETKVTTYENTHEQLSQPIQLRTVPTVAESIDKFKLKRKSFCSKIHSSNFAYFQEMCKSAHPNTINYAPKPLANDQLGLTPVAILGTNRSNTLYRSLRALTSADGVDPSLITVFFDGIFVDPTHVVQLFDIRIQYNIISPTLAVIPQDRVERNKYYKNRIDRHYKVSLDKLFGLFPDAKQAIILEDDLEVSPDFFSYFNQTIGLLYEDPSLYCISAWNDFSFQHSSQDPTLLYRVDTMPGLGWILTRSLYEEIGPKWPTESEPLTWDGWLREPAQRKGRECIMPDVCRTFHFSQSGAHISQIQQKRLFEVHSFNRRAKPHRLQTKKQASPVNHSLSLCSESLIPDTKDHTYVIYIQGGAALMEAMACFKLWDIDYRPGHKDSYRFFHKNNHIILIRCSESPYCRYKPEGLPFITQTPQKKRP